MFERRDFEFWKFGLEKFTVGLVAWVRVDTFSVVWFVYMVFVFMIFFLLNFSRTNLLLKRGMIEIVKKKKSNENLFFSKIYRIYLEKFLFFKIFYATKVSNPRLLFLINIGCQIDFESMRKYHS